MSDDNGEEQQETEQQPIRDLDWWKRRSSISRANTSERRPSGKKMKSNTARTDKRDNSRFNTDLLKLR
jgi:hypothetical protein